MSLSFWLFLAVFYLGYFQYGLSVSAMNAMLEHLSDDLGFDKSVGGAIVAAALYLCTGLGSPLAGSFEKVFKEFTQMVIGIVFLAGSALCIFATSHKICWRKSSSSCVSDMVLCGRITTGFASAMALVLSPRYLAQVSPIQIRGALLSGLQLCGTTGILVGFLIGTPYDFGDADVGYEWWRLMFVFTAIPACAQIPLACVALPLYRLPRKELQMRFESRNAVDALADTSLLENTNPSHELIDESVTAPVVPDRVPRWRQAKETAAALFSRKYRRCVVLGLGVPLVAHCAGVNILLSYSTTILKDAGFNKPVIGGCIMGLAFVVGTAFSTYLCDRTGRRTLALISFAGMTTCCLGLSLSSLAGETVSSLASVGLVILFISFFSIGGGTLNMTYAAEVSPPELSAAILGLGTLMKSCISMLLVLAFPSVLDACGAFLSFLFLTILNFLALTFITLYVIETKGRSLEDIVSELTYQ